MAIPNWFWVLLVALGVLLILLEQGVSLSDIGIFLILIGGGKILWDYRRKRDP